jgi:hypothetical protein
MLPKEPREILIETLNKVFRVQLMEEEINLTSTAEEDKNEE